MTERPASSEPTVSPKSSESDPPAANQPVGDAAATQPTSTDSPPATKPRPQPAPEIVPGQPDGEVDTRR